MISEDIQQLAPSAIIDLFVIDSTNIDGGEIIRWHNGVNELGSNITWAGDTYTRLPIEAGGFAKKSAGTLPRPTLSIANVSGVTGAYSASLDDLIGAKVTRIRTFVKYLDAVNFSAGNLQADPNVAFDNEVWTVDRKASENGIFILFELAASFDLAGVKLPRRQVIQNICSWKYRSAECGYTGGAVAKADDAATSILSEDACGKRTTSCKLRFDENVALPYGGFIGAGKL